jgi:4-hydroxy-tetrahydrodipicolinate reductase
VPERLGVVFVGLGPIGQEAAALALKKSYLEVRGGVDIDPQKVGQDLGDLLGLGRRLGVNVTADLRRVLDEASPDVVVLCTGSYFLQVFGQLITIIEAGASVVSTCEELVYPWAGYPEQARQLDMLAQKHGVTVLGTGVNPGFVMDTMALFFSGICQQVRRVSAWRVVDAATRRRPLQEKVGAGLTPERFRASVEAGRVRHVGLRESAYLVAAGLGWRLTDYRETIEPVIASEPVATEYVSVEPGQVAGVRQVGRGFRDGEPVVELTLEMYVGAKNPRDVLTIDGVPPVEVEVAGGIHGDRATAAIVVNAIPRVAEAPPGLLTMKDLPLVHLRA